MPRIGPPLRDYVPQVAIAELDDPEAIGPHYDELRTEALEGEGEALRDHGREDVAECVRNRDRGALHPEQGDRGKLGSEV